VAAAAVGKRAATDIEPALPAEAAAELTQRLWQPLLPSASPAGSASAPLLHGAGTILGFGAAGDGDEGADTGVEAGAEEAEAGAMPLSGPSVAAKPLPSWVAAATRTPQHLSLLRRTGAAIRGEAPAAEDEEEVEEEAEEGGEAGDSGAESGGRACGSEQKPSWKERLQQRRQQGGRPARSAVRPGEQLQARGRVVGILELVHTRAVVGILRPGDDSHPADKPIPDRHAYVRLVSSCVRLCVLGVCVSVSFGTRTCDW
jgi:hypothetical protein